MDLVKGSNYIREVSVLKVGSHEAVFKVMGVQGVEVTLSTNR